MTTKVAAALSTLLLTLAMAIAADEASQGSFRKWTDASGKFEVEAEFVGVSLDRDTRTTSVMLTIEIIFSSENLYPPVQVGKWRFGRASWTVQCKSTGAKPCSTG